MTPLSLHLSRPQTTPILSRNLTSGNSLDISTESTHSQRQEEPHTHLRGLHFLVSLTDRVDSCGCLKKASIVLEPTQEHSISSLKLTNDPEAGSDVKSIPVLTREDQIHEAGLGVMDKNQN